MLALAPRRRCGYLETRWIGPWRHGQPMSAPYLRLPGFLPLMALAGAGSQQAAMRCTTASRCCGGRWEASGRARRKLLWVREGVLAEVVVFVVVGPTLLRCGFGPKAGAAALAASARVFRWSVTAVTAWLPAMLLEPCCMASQIRPVASGMHANALVHLFRRPWLATAQERYTAPSPSVR